MNYHNLNILNLIYKTAIIKLDNDKKISNKQNKENFLGQKTKYNLTNPHLNILEGVKNPHTDIDYSIKLTCPEFTSICPITSQPDFAHIIIDYVPNQKIIESKSLKLYLFSYRNHGAFHEDCTIQIAKDIINCIKPKWLRISGFWYPRGGIPIDIFFENGTLPKNIFIKENNSYNYLARS